MQKEIFRKTIFLKANCYFILFQGYLCAIARAFIIDQIFSGSCKSPPPASDFTNQRYTGLWYEIGKMQTKGGAFFEKDCVCTTIDVEQKTGSGDYTAINSCRKLAPTGDFLNATGMTLIVLRNFLICFVVIFNKWNIIT